MSEEKKSAVTEEVKEEVRKLTEEELERVTGGSLKSKCQPVSADSTTCYWLTHLKFSDDYRPLDESKPQTCGNCFYFNSIYGCTSQACGC